MDTNETTAQTTRYFFAGNQDVTGKQFNWLFEATAHRDSWLHNNQGANWRIGMIHRIGDNEFYFDLETLDDDSWVTLGELTALRWLESVLNQSEGADKLHGVEAYNILHHAIGSRIVNSKFKHIAELI